MLTSIYYRKYFFFLWIIFTVAVAMLYLQARGAIIFVRQSFLVPIQYIQHGEYGDYAFLALMETDSLSQNNSFDSPAVLLENGRAIGPGNVSHSEIGEKGRGRFSFWQGGSLIFSTSDNSDPRVNGRQYRLSLPVILDSTEILILFVGAVLLSFWIETILWKTFQRHTLGMIFVALMVLFLGGVGPFWREFKSIYSLARTQIYVLTFDPQEYERRGSDYCNPRFDPERIGKELSQIDIAKDYDFSRLSQVRAFLWGVDRRVALKHIFETVTQGAKTDTEKHLALLEFLNKASYHNIFTPGIVSYDPLVNLELGEIWCSDVAHLAIDLFSAAGYQARMVQLSRHQIAEIYYDNNWHYFDADVFSGGAVARMPDGSIPSVNDLGQDGRNVRLDSMPIYYERLIINSCYPEGWGEGVWQDWSESYGTSYFYFSSLYYQITGASSVYYVKAATPEEERLDPWNYGWHKYEIVPDTERVLEPLPLRYTPSLSYFDSIVKDPETRQIHLTFHATDGDDDMLGYRIYISRESRDWDYSKFYGVDDARAYWSLSSGWAPEMYDAYHRLPPSDVDLVITTEGNLSITLPQGEIYYLTVMAYDAYGELVGRELYPASNEIKLSW